MNGNVKSMVRVLVTMVAVLAIAVCCFGCSSATNKDASLTAQTTPKNGEILNGSGSGNSAIQVSASSSADCYVKVMSGSKTVVGFYVRKGSSAKVSVPAGTYAVHFAQGTTWYGKSDVFGSGTAYGQDKSVTISANQVLEYTLTYSSSGNFNMGSLDAKNF